MTLGVSVPEPAEFESKSRAAASPAAAASLFPEAGLPTAEQIQQQITPVLNMTLSPRLEYWASRYAEVGHRNVYLWKWCRQGVEITTLGCVAPEFREEVCETRVLGIILDVLMDDVADRHGDAALLDKLTSLSFQGRAPDFSEFPPQERAYAEFTVELWQEIISRASRFPCYPEYARLLEFDYQQLFNVMRYSHLVNENLSLLNLAEHDLYTPHNMHMMISGTLDLMCSPDFNTDELGVLRDLLWHAQCMGRVGNLVTTWERELADGDYSSGVYASAVSCGDVTLAQLRDGDREAIRAGVVNGGHESRFLDRWHDHRRYLLDKAPLIRSFDFRENVRGLERLICLHLGSRGYK